MKDNFQICAQQSSSKLKFKLQLLIEVYSKRVNIDKLIKSEHFNYSYIPLRGTIDWHFNDDCSQVLSGRSKTQTLQEAVFVGANVEKYEPFRRHYPFKQLSGQFEKDLAEAKHLLLIGFSLRQEEICLLMHDHVKQYKKIILVSVDDEESFDVLKTCATNLLIRHTANYQATFLNEGFEQQAQQKIIKALND